MQILAPGAKVTIGKDIEAQIVSAMIESEEKVSYRVLWWDGNTRKVEWVEAFEIVPDEQATKTKVGFHNRK